MGIKFLCPNGHKLHVKSFLSGKKAICPKCGARVIVPDEDAGPDERSLDAGLVDAGVQVESAVRTLGTADAATESVDLTLVDDAFASLSTTESVAIPLAPPEPAPPRLHAADPLEEAAGAAWYVRASTGGQYGPASAEIMRNWLKEGRIGAGSLVWRAPWTEWQNAASLFPQLKAESAGPAGINGTPMPPASLPVGQAVQGLAPEPPQVAAESSLAPLARAARKRRRKNDISLIASGVLAAISLILVIVLVLVFRSQHGGENPPKTEDPPPASEKTPDPLV